MGQIEKNNKQLIQSKDEELREKQALLDAKQLSVNSQEKRLKEKDKRLHSQETKIIDLQEEGVARMNEFEQEMSSQKQHYEH